MLKNFMLTPVFNTLISAVAIIFSALLGGACTWFITKKAAIRNEKLQNKLLQDTRKYERYEYMNKICDHANLIRMDICTALFGSIRGLTSIRNKDNNDVYPFPINSNYSLSITFLNEKFDLKELSYIYQLYGIIEKLNHDIKNLHFNIDEFKLIEIDYEIFLKKLYGSNFNKVLDIDIDTAQYKNLYDNNLIKLGYREVLKKLDNICTMDFNH